jgi:hypothetical protein
MYNNKNNKINVNYRNYLIFSLSMINIFNEIYYNKNKLIEILLESINKLRHF